ncbi:MAG TPA: transglutaminase-like cysteine peptidase [Xanthobacteraceae bacterium]|nr:transglutaminase-like cysteine peptidase [Xanthobacteraceae bacterium]
MCSTIRAQAAPRRVIANAVGVALLALAALAFSVEGAAAKSRRPHPTDASTGFGALPHIAPIPLSDPAVTPAVTAPARFFTINKVLAKLDGVAPPSGPVRLAAREPGSASDAAGPVAPMQGSEPFGLFAFRAPENALWSKWRGVEDDIANDLDAMERCRAAQETCARPTAQFVALIDAARALEGRARLDAVNRAVNGAIRYMTDMEQFGVEDLWSSPLATFRTGLGDCEDYAIAKYVALREAGVATADLRIVLARDIAIREDHAVLAARLDGRWLILDNRRADLADDSAVRQLMPLFAIGQQGVQMFAAPYVEQTIGRDGADLAPATAEPAPGAGGVGIRPVLM